MTQPLKLYSMPFGLEKSRLFENRSNWEAAFRIIQSPMIERPRTYRSDVLFVRDEAIATASSKMAAAFKKRIL